MIKQCLLLFTMTFLFTGNGITQIRSKQTKKPQAKSEITDIRRVDFLNFTYQSRLCSQEIPGIPKTVKIRSGEFQNDEGGFSVVGNKIVYGDLNSDGREDAIVFIDCMSQGANFSMSEIFIYTLENGRATMLAGLDDNDMERDYKQYYPNGFLWSGSTGLKVKGNNLAIDKFAEGTHVAPKYLVKMNYRVNGTNLTLSRKPLRTRSGF